MFTHLARSKLKEVIIKFLDVRDVKLVVNFVDKLVGLEEVRRLKSRKIDWCYSDDLDWLPDSFNFNEFVTALTAMSAGIKVFHGCRPLSVNSYYQLGFSANKHTQLKKQFEETFSDIHSNITVPIFEFIYETRSDENTKTYFICDTERLVNGGAGNYIIYGSEMLLCAARALEEELEKSLVDRLKSVGIPTIFEVDLPYELIPDSQVKDFARTLLAAWGNFHKFPEENRGIEFVVITNDKVLPEHIVNHYHPTKILDRHRFPPTFYYFDASASPS